VGLRDAIFLQIKHSGGVAEFMHPTGLSVMRTASFP
jgi:hypothetical protein